ncbi:MULTISPECIES: hypothetical protein [unclassified Xanthomonas]|uniref:hypothetical protein n=1 Tax=unclassified Xanthomonas TaxID=2643310 RepID=UPI0012647267|nr:MULTISPECIES: hypothetical protein [unclassified Xanthomonas]MDY4340306.1 hypothetical protein [Xanthomonas sp. LF07-6]
MKNSNLVLRPAPSACIFMVLPLVVVELVVIAGFIKAGSFDLLFLIFSVMAIVFVFYCVAFNAIFLDGGYLCAWGPFSRQRCSVKGRLVEVGFRGRGDKEFGLIHSVGFYISLRDQFSNKILLEKNLKIFKRGDIANLVGALAEAGAIVDIDKISRYFMRL